MFSAKRVLAPTQGQASAVNNTYREKGAQLCGKTHNKIRKPGPKANKMTIMKNN
jgi:hypothetical protein